MPEPDHTDDEIDACQLNHLQTLASEIDVAIHCIGHNALGNLEESVAKQEMLCASLMSTGTKAAHTIPAARTIPTPELASAVANLGKRSLHYAALLRHSGRSIALLSAHCNSHIHPSQEAREPRSKHQTWSCEM